MESEEFNVLTRGSVLFAPLLRASRRADEEKGYVVAGTVAFGMVRVCDRRAAGLRNWDALRGRNIGRKAERFILGGGAELRSD
jgi:hypothetical protein